MSENNRVIWSEGLFLRPQHFQQHDRYLDELIVGRFAAGKSYLWGIYPEKQSTGGSWY